MLQALTLNTLAAIAALAVSSSMGYAAPAPKIVPINKSVPIKMSDPKLDSVTAGSDASGSDITIICSFGTNCNGNGQSYNGDPTEVINALHEVFDGSDLLGVVNIRTLSGSVFFSGNSVLARYPLN